MVSYRIYYLGAGQGLWRVEDIRCADDAEAIKLAESRRGDQRLQLWRDKVLVQRFEAREAEG